MFPWDNELLEEALGSHSSSRAGNWRAMSVSRDPRSARENNAHDGRGERGMTGEKVSIG